MTTAAELLREARRRHGIAQRSLARRSGTSQSWISEIERGLVSPSADALRRLLHCLGEELVLSTRRLDGHARHDSQALRDAQAKSPAERFVDAASWGELASSLTPER